MSAYALIAELTGLTVHCLCCGLNTQKCDCQRQLANTEKDRVHMCIVMKCKPNVLFLGCPDHPEAPNMIAQLHRFAFLSFLQHAVVLKPPC